MWQEVLDAFEKTKTVCHAIDLPGFGQNNTCVSSIGEMSDYVIAYMAEHNIAQAIVIGHSMGGYIALDMLQNYPNRCKAIGLIHSHAFADSEEKTSNRTKLIDFITKNGQHEFLKQFAKQLVGPTMSADLNKAVHHLVKGTTPNAIIKASQAMIDRKDHTETLQAPVPFLWIIGKEDKFMPYKQVLDQAKLCQDPTIHLLEHVGHLCMYEDPKRTVEILTDFIGSVSDSTH